MQKFWSSKWIFILAAIWSAAWLGNLWRFPYQVYDNGGAAFIIAYLVILFILWFGLLIWEIALWQYTWKWAPWAIWTVNKYLKWIWWAGIFTAWVILSYYVVVIWWWIDYLWYSLVSLFTGTTLPWISNSSDFFFNNVLNLTDGISNMWWVSIAVLIWTIVSWILIYFSTFKSVNSVSKVILFTATIPFISLAILAIRAFTLPWAEQWLAFLVNIDMDKLFSLSTWIAAAWQIFFTLSLAMGIMIAYGALKRKDSEIVQSVILVAIWNTIISFLSAIAVFGTLGYLANVKQVAITEVVKWWPSLAFVTLPETITLLPSLQSLFAVIFFATIFLLAIDSAISLIEAVSVAIRNKFKKLRIEILTLIIVVILWLISLIYTFSNGLYVLDIVDHFVTSYSMLFIWILEAIILLIMWKKLSAFIDERNSCKLKFILNKYYFLVSWLIAFIVLTYLLYKNIASWLNYEWYDKSYLIFYWVYVIIWIYTLSVLLNLIDRSEEKDNN